MRRPSAQNTNALLYKILIMGNSSVGKTSLLRRWADKIFSTSYKATLGVDFKNIYCRSDDKEVILQFWDIAGQEFQCNKNMMGPYCQKAVAVCLMWDSRVCETYEDLPKFFDVIQDKLSLETPIIFVAGKVDETLEEEKKEALSKQESDIQQKAKNAGFKTVNCVRTSSRDNIGCEKLEGILLEQIHALTEVSKNPKPTKPSIQLAAPKKKYEPAPYSHTRQVRYKYLLEIINRTEVGKLLAKERVWMEMNLHSINDPRSQTSRLIKEFLEENPEKNPKENRERNPEENPQEITEESSSGNPENLSKDDTFAQQFYEAQDLLDLISKKETQIFGFKLILSFFKETRKAQRAQHHCEIEKLYQDARKIYDAMLPEPKDTDTKSIENNNNSSLEI